LAALNISVINSSAQHPAARGKAEKAVGTVKLILKKMLTVSNFNSFNWEMLPFMVSKIMNHTVTLKTGFKPSEMIFGKGPSSKAFFEQEPNFQLHHSLKNEKQKVETLTKELVGMTEIVKQKLEVLKLENNEKININKISKPFKTDDIVYVLDRYILIGNPRPLKSKFFPSPWKVIRPLYTTTLVQRIADGFTALYSNNDLKKISSIDPLIMELPKEIQEILLKDFKNMLDYDLGIIRQIDPLNIPDSIELIDTVDPNNESEYTGGKLKSLLELPLQGEGTVIPPEIEEIEENTNTPKNFQDQEEEEEEDPDEENQEMKLRSGKRVRFA
jgi:hypothetical protein